MKRVIIILATLLLCGMANPVKAEAGLITGDEALGGMSYIIDCAAKKEKLPEKYERLFLLHAEDCLSERHSLATKEYDILCRIVEAEATGGTIDQKRNVASCVLARVYSSNWPNTVEGVVFQKRQFSPIDDGRYYTVKITESTIEAVDLTLREGLTHDCIYFCTPTCKSYKSGWHHTLQEVFQDGMHAYFKGE